MPAAVAIETMTESPPREPPPSQNSSETQPSLTSAPDGSSVEKKNDNSRGLSKDEREKSDRGDRHREKRDRDGNNYEKDSSPRERGRGGEKDRGDHDRDRYHSRRRSRSSKKSSKRYDSRSRSPYRRGKSWKGGRRGRSRSRSYSRSSSNERRRRRKRSYSSSSRSGSPSPSPQQQTQKKEKVSKFSDNRAPSSSVPSTAPPLQTLDPNALAALQQQQQLALRLVLAGNANQASAAPTPSSSSSSFSSLYPSSQHSLTTSSLFPFPSAVSSLFPNPSLPFPLANPLASPFFVGEPKEHKELFIGNTPSGVTEVVILEFLNAAMRHTGLYSGPEGIEPIVTCRLNSKFAFIEMRTAHDATNAMNLNNIPFLGNLLKIGRPSKYCGPITPNVTWQELISGSGFTKLHSTDSSRSSAPHDESNAAGLPSLTSSSQSTPGLTHPSLLSSSAAAVPSFSSAVASAITAAATAALPVPDASTKTFREIFVGNTSLEMNAENLKEFMGNAMEKMGLLTAPGNPILQVRVNPRFSFIEMRSIEEAANCLNLNGIPFLGQSLKLSRPAKYAGALVTHYTWDDILSRWMTGELKLLTSGPSSRVVMLSNMVLLEDLSDDETYQEIISETRDEISNYGHLQSIVIPRPSQGPSLGAGISLHRGVGKVFIEMSTEDEAKSVLVALKGRTFDGRIVDAKYFPYEKFLIQDFSDPPPVILTANGFIDLDTVLGNKLSGQTITMNTPTAAQLSSYAHLNHLPMRSTVTATAPPSAPPPSALGASSSVPE